MAHPEKFALRLSEVLAKIKARNPALAGSLAREFGGFGSFLLLGPKAVAAAIAEQKKIGGATEESPRKAQELQTAYTKLGQTISDIGRKIAVDLAPWIEHVLASMRD